MSTDINKFGYRVHLGPPVELKYGAILLTQSLFSLIHIDKLEMV